MNLLHKALGKALPVLVVAMIAALAPSGSSVCQAQFFRFPMPKQPPKQDDKAPAPPGAPAVTGNPNAPQSATNSAPPPSVPQTSAYQALQAMMFPQVTPADPANPTIKNQPDPNKLYREAISKIAEHHKNLKDKEAIEGFKKKWLAIIDAEDAKPIASLKAADDLIRAALKSLDQRFDNLLVPEEVKEENTRFESSAVGIGVEIEIKGVEELYKNLPDPDHATEEDVDKVLIVSDKHPLILTPVKGSPAAKAGIKEGDRLAKVNGKDLNGMTLNQASSLVGGKEHTDVELTVERVDAGGKPVAVKPIIVRRSKFIVPVVKTQDLGDGITYVKLSTYAADMADAEMQAALRKAAKGKMLIFDIRNNGGGRLDHAINIISYFLAEGTIVVQQERTAEGMDEKHHSVTRTVMIQTGPAVADEGSIAYVVSSRKLIVPEDMPVVLLVNGRSASASDLTAGALKFNGRAKLVGTRTFGKGVGQRLIELPYDRRLKVTSFTFLPAGKPVDWLGVDVDLEVEAQDGDVDVQLEAAKKLVRQEYEATQKRLSEKKASDEAALKLKKEQWEERMRKQKQLEQSKK